MKLADIFTTTFNWLGWSFLAIIFIGGPILIAANGEPLRGLGIFLFWHSLWAAPCAVHLTFKLVKPILRKFPKNFIGYAEVSLIFFVFLYIPVLIANFTNAKMNTSVELGSPDDLFHWAVIAAIFGPALSSLLSRVLPDEDEMGNMK